MATMDDEPRRSASLPELLLITSVALLLVGGTVFVWRGDAPPKVATHDSIPAVLTRMEAAKSQYAADNRLPPGTWLTISTLQKSGYLPATNGSPDDIHFVPGAVGENVTYHFADGAHIDHSAPPR